MQFTVETQILSQLNTACLVLPVFSERRPAAADALPAETRGALDKILQGGDLDGEAGQTLLLFALPGLAAERVLLLGVGAERELTRKSWNTSLGKALRLLQDAAPTEVVIIPPEQAEAEREIYLQARDCAQAAIDKGYRFDACKSDPKPPKYPLAQLGLWLADAKGTTTAERGLRHGAAIGRGMNLARDLANLPGNLLTPTDLAARAQQLGEAHAKLNVQILEEADMAELKMGALLSVSRGSRQPAKLIVMEYRGGAADEKPIALVGKGLTFDAGGISIKPADKMDEMKYDMCGGASVFGALSTCAELDLPINVVGVVPSSENLPDGDANKPGDIVTAMSGQTIEILNTDAEGRLILCDALTYTERFEPSTVIDIATLTGACVVALGNHAHGLMGNDQALVDELLRAGTDAQDRAWQLPLWEEYDKQINSDIADMANLGGRFAGAITAGCFLARFTQKMQWAHLDVAGTAWPYGKSKKVSGRPVPLLVQFLLSKLGY